MSTCAGPVFGLGSFGTGRLNRSDRGERRPLSGSHFGVETHGLLADD